MSDNRDPAIYPIKFWTDYEPDPQDPGKKIAVDWVSWIKKADSAGATTQSKVSRLKPRENRQGVKVVAVEWAAIEPHYKAWKASEEPPEDGTPLIAWPGCNEALCSALKKMNIRTVEDFAEAPNSAFSGLPVPNVRYLREQAASFLIAQGEVSAVAEELSKRDQEIEDLKIQISELNALVKNGKASGKPPAGSSKANAS